MRPVAAWLALWHDSIFTEIVTLDPAVLLDHGDPQSLPPRSALTRWRLMLNAMAGVDGEG